MIQKVYLFPNTAVVCFDERGEQVPEWQAVLFCAHLRKLKDAGVLDAEAVIHAGHGLQKVSDWITD